MCVKTSNLENNVVRWPSKPSFQTILRRVLVIIALSLLAYGVRPLPLAAQADFDAEVEFFIQSDEPNPRFTVGDQITLRLEIIHPPNSRVVLPQLEEEAWQPFTIVDQTAPETVDNGDGTATTGRNIIVSLFQPGEYDTPSVVVTHRKPDGSIEDLGAPIIPITIVSILVEGDAELRDLKAQAALPVPAIWPWLLGGLLVAILLLGLLAGLAIWLYHRRQTQAEPELVPVPVFDTRPPEVIAHAELNRIQALELPAKNEIKEHYSLVALCLRRYIEGRYAIPAVEKTTMELRAAFREAAISHNDSTGLIKLMTESDFVKFARYRPQETRVNSLIDKAHAVVDMTTAAAATQTPPPVAESNDAVPVSAPPETEEVNV